jgi:hypothetical protein
MITVQKALRNKLISTSEPSSIRKASRARGKRIHRTCITWVQRNNSTCASNHTSISRLRGFRRSRDALAPSWYAGGSSWKTNYMVLMNLAGPEAGRNFTNAFKASSSYLLDRMLWTALQLPDPTGLLYRSLR